MPKFLISFFHKKSRLSNCDTKMSSSSEEDNKKPAAIRNYDKNQPGTFKKKQRSHAQDKKRSRKKKKNINHENSWEEYCKFMNSNLEKKKRIITNLPTLSFTNPYISLLITP